MKAFVYILILFLLLWWVYKASFFRVSSLKRWLLPSVFLVKVGVSFIIYFIYTRYYDPNNADIIRLFDDGEALNLVARFKPATFFRLLFINDLNDPEIYSAAELMYNWDISNNSFFWSNSRFLIVYHSLVRFISFGNIHVHNLIAVFIGFCGQVAFFKTFLAFMKDMKYFLFAVVFLIPSVLFWSSAAFKEPFIIFCLGFLFYYGLRVIKFKFSIKRVLIILISAFLLFMLRINVFLIFISLIIPFIFCRKFPKYVFVKYLVFVLIGFFLTVAQYQFYPQKNIYLSSAAKHNAYVDLAIDNESSSLVTKEYLSPQPKEFIQKIPKAVLNAFFRPHMFEADTILKKVTALENVFLFAFLLLGIIFLKKPMENKNLFWFVISFAILNLLIIGLLIPVSGAIVRYKITVLPILLTGILMIFNYDKFRLYFNLQKS